MSNKQKKEYSTVKIGEVITQIAHKTEAGGYTIGVMEIFFPDDEEYQKWSEKKCNEWVAENNKRMEAICKFLNENNL